MPFTIDTPEPYVLMQIYGFQSANNLLDNDRSIRDSLDTEHDWTTGEHEGPETWEAVAQFTVQVHDSTILVTESSWSIGFAGTGVYTIGAYAFDLDFSFAAQEWTTKASASGQARITTGGTPEVPTITVVAQALPPRIINWEFVSTDLNKIKINFYDDAGTLVNPDVFTVACQGVL